MSKYDDWLDSTMDNLVPRGICNVETLQILFQRLARSIFDLPGYIN